MSETMIERIAKAISDAIDPTSGDPIGVTFHHSEFVEGETMQEQLEQVKSICLAAARAAIEAMHNPPDEVAQAMNEVAIDGPGYVDFYPSLNDCGRLFNAAINEILHGSALFQSTNSLPSEDR